MNDDDLALAFELAADAAAISLSWSGGDVPVTTKPDGSPVSEADLEVDRTLIDILGEERPDDGILSEESDEVPGTSGRRWIIDPIDGTRSFIAGRPGWGNHISLEIDGEIVLGVITRPENDELVWAVAGQGAYRCGMDAPQDRSRPLRVSTVSELREVHISGYGVGGAQREALAAHAQWEPSPTSHLVDYLAGEMDALLLNNGSVWDYAPMAVLAVEAGGAVRSPDGGMALDQSSFLCANPATIDRLAELFYRR